MKRCKKAAFLAAMVLSLAFATGCFGASPPSGGASGGAPPSGGGASAPGESQSRGGAGAGWNFALDTTDLSGAAVDETAFAGNRLTVLNVWATWCPPCVGELPELQQVSEAYADSGVQVVGVLQDGVDGQGERDEEIIGAARQLLQDAGAEYAVILPDAAFEQNFIEDMQYFPTTFFLDENGEVVETVVGANTFKDWSKAIDKALEKLG